MKEPIVSGNTITPHAVLSPSSAERWCNCPGSIEFTKGMRDTQSEHAQWGTCAHYCLQALLERWHTPAELLGLVLFINSEGLVLEYGKETTPDSTLIFDYHQDPVTGSWGHSWTVTKEMVECALVAFEFVQEKAAGKANASIQSERRVYMEELLDLPAEKCRGTVDITIKADGYLGIFDLKGGKGYVVEVKGNLQLILYGIGAYCGLTDLERRELEVIELGIIQPRANHKDGPIRTVKMTPSDMWQWVAWLSKSAKDALNPDAPRIPGEAQCRWCRGKPTCPEVTYVVVEGLLGGKSDGTGQSIVASVEPRVLQEPNDYTLDQISGILELIPLARDWMTAVESYGTELALKGTHIPGHKVVRKTTHQRWKESNGDTIKKLTSTYKFKKAEVIKPETPISPAAAVKLVKSSKSLTDRQKANFQKLIVKPEGAPTLVPESDPRPAMALTADQMFAGAITQQQEQ